MTRVAKQNRNEAKTLQTPTDKCVGIGLYRAKHPRGVCLISFRGKCAAETVIIRLQLLDLTRHLDIAKCFSAIRWVD